MLNFKLMNLKLKDKESENKWSKFTKIKILFEFLEIFSAFYNDGNV